MAQIRDLFKSQKKDLYGKLGEIRIESKGFVDVARSAALLASSPNKVADIIGNQVGGALGGFANRPDDTIFRSEAPFAKPLTLIALTQAQLRNAVDADRAYYVKDTPAPNSIIKRLLDGQSPASAAALVAQQGLNKFGSVKELKKLATQLKNANATPNGFAPEFGRTELGGKPMGTTKKFSEYKQVVQLDVRGEKPATNILGDIVSSVTTTPYPDLKNKIWDLGTDKINRTEKYDSLTDLQTDISYYRDANQVWVLFRKEGNKSTVPFVGAVTGLSENVSPEWTNFRYLGSPFKVNRYLGVERNLQFTLKLYYTTVREKDVMIKKVNYLKSLAFPYEEISEMKYGNDTQTSQYAFSPNLIYLTIGDMYKNVYGYIESLSFEIDDNTTWPSGDPNGSQLGRSRLFELFKLNNDNTLYPSVIDVQIGMKIIENHKTVTQGGITKYKYNFDGLSYEDDGITPIKEFNKVGWMTQSGADKLAGVGKFIINETKE
jgi:hypothetical protein